MAFKAGVVHSNESESDHQYLFGTGVERVCASPVAHSRKLTNYISRLGSAELVELKYLSADVANKGGAKSSCECNQQNNLQ